MATLAQKFRLARMGKAKRTLLEAGLIDETGVHTQEGRNLMWAFLFENFEDAMVEIAREQLKEDANTVKKSK